MASLRQFSDSQNWYCCLTLPDGRRVQHSTGQSERKKAMAVCLEWERAARLAKEGNFTEDASRKILSHIAEMSGLNTAQAVSTKDYLLQWSASKEITKAPGTARRYKHTIESFLNYLGEERIQKGIAGVNSGDITRFRDLQIKEGKSPSTANMAVKTLRIPFNLARRQALILSNPAEGVEALPNNQGERNAFSREQITSLLREANTEWKGMILFGVCHGLRIGDAAKLSWQNINTDRRSIIFYPEKTSHGAKRRPEEYPLHPDVEAYLEDLASIDDPKAPLFPTLSRTRRTGAHGLSLLFRKLMHQVGIYTEGEGEDKKTGKGRRFFNLGFHSLRHTAISEQANQGVTREIRMKLSDSPQWNLSGMISRVG